MQALLVVLSTLLLSVNGVTWELGTKEPNLPEADVSGVARDYLLPTFAAYKNLQQLATVGGTGAASLCRVCCLIDARCHSGPAVSKIVCRLGQ